MSDDERSLGARIYAGLFKVYGQAQISPADEPTSAYPDIAQAKLTDWEVHQARDGSSYLVARSALGAGSDVTPGP